MKFKLFSAVLLLVCFVFLGVLTEAIPVRELPEDMAAGLFSALTPRDTPGPTPTAAVTPAIPTARTAPAATPVYTALPSPDRSSPAPAVTPAGLPEASHSPAGTWEPTAGPVPTGTAAPTAGPTPALEPTSAPAPTPAPAQTGEDDLWEPDAAVISTTITWNDPLQNETDYSVDGSALLGQALDISLPAEGPQVLIIHTHGTEAYTPDGADRYQASSDYRTTDPDHSILRVGQALAEALEACGLDVLVDTGLYDWPNYDGAYARSGEAIQSYLEADPSIRVVIDLHRDALGDDATVYKTISDQVRPEAAQIMFVVGTDKTLPHPDWRENLAFAMGLQGVLEEEYPHIMRPTLLSTNRYNQQLTPASVLLEIGTAGNTLQEAVTAAELFAQAVGPVLAARVGA